MTRVVRPGTSTGSPASIDASAQAADSGSTPTIRAPAKPPHHRRGERADADLHRDEVRLGADLRADRRVPLDHPCGHGLVARPRRVLDDDHVRPRQRGRALDGLVVGAGDDLDPCALGGDRLAARRHHRVRHEDRGPSAELPRHPRERPPVVAVRRAGEHRRPPAAGERAVGRPRRAEHLERRQPEPARLVLDQHALDARAPRPRPGASTSGVGA